MSYPKVAIIILNYKSWLDTIECIESCLKLNYSNFKIFVVDNNSNDCSRNSLKNWVTGMESYSYNKNIILKDLCYPPVKKPLRYSIYIYDQKSYKKVYWEENSKIIFIWSSENNGYAAGNNIAINFVRNYNYKFIWVLNNDTIVQKDALATLIKFHAERSDLRYGLLGSALLYYDDPRYIQSLGGVFNKYFATSKQLYKNTLYLKEKRYNNSKIDYIEGAATLISSDFIEDVGLMNEAYFLYYEEIDWALRGKLRGWKIKVVNNSIVYHKEGRSTKRVAKRADNKVEYFALRNRFLIIRQFFPKRIIFTYLSFILVVINRLRRFQFKKSLLAFKIMFFSNK